MYPELFRGQRSILLRGSQGVVRFAGSEGTDCTAQTLQAFDNTSNYTGVPSSSLPVCVFIPIDSLSQRRNQAIRLHWLDIVYQVTTLTADFRDNCFTHNFTVTVMNNEDSLHRVPLMGKAKCSLQLLLNVIQHWRDEIVSSARADTVSSFLQTGTQ